MVSYGTSHSYVYRADGMRVSKLVGSTATTYAYDGQMGMEDVDTTAGISTVTDYGLGARGVDYISSTKSGTTTVGFPIYDAHGNMTACLFGSGSNYYSLGNQRHYDAWGAIRNGAISGDPKGRYCANLGHKQDDESGLVYMRARYYEPSSGRFLNEDPENSGSNWFEYGSNDPLRLSDKSGKSPLDPSLEQVQSWLFEIEALCLECATAKVIFMAQLPIWLANAALCPSLAKDLFAAEAPSCILPTQPLPTTSPEDQAVRESEAYALSLTIDMWLILSDGPPGLDG